MFKKIKLQNQIKLFAIILSIVLLFSFILPIYYTFENIVFQQVSENSRMMLSQMNLLDSYIFSRLENLALSITMDEQISEGLHEMSRKNGADQIGAINKITHELLFYQGSWDEISDITIFTEKMELEPYFVDWGLRYIRNVNSEEYRKIENRIAERREGLILMTDDLSQDSEPYIIFFRKMDIYSEKENGDILCVKIAEHVFEKFFAEKYSDDSSYYMVNESGEMIAGTQGYDFYKELLNRDPECMDEWMRGSGSFVKTLNHHRYIISNSDFNQFGIRMIEFRPYESLMPNMAGLMLKMLLLGGIILSILIPLISLFSNKLVRPIVYLCGQMKKVGDGDFNVTVEEGYTNEIGQMNKHFVSMAGKIKVLIQNIEQVSQQKNIAEFEVLQQQINPHFLYNVLDSINWMAIRAKQENISLAVVQLGSFFRLSLAKGKSIITLREELERLQNYIALQKLCTNKQIYYVEDMEPQLYDEKIIRLILQPFVENAIVHGYSTDGEECEITVSGWSDEKDFYIQISDEGVGVSQETMEAYLKKGVSNDGSYGIYNVNQRIKLYYGEKYGIHYLPVRKGTTVQIHLSRELEDDNVSDDDRR